MWLLDASAGELITTFGGSNGPGLPVRVVFSTDSTRLVATGGVQSDLVRHVVRHAQDPCVRIIDLHTEMMGEFIDGYGDATAIAAGPDTFPWRALVRGGETVVESAVDACAVPLALDEGSPPGAKEWMSHNKIRFPVPFEWIETHPKGRIWAGVLGAEVYLIQLRTRH